MHILVWEATQDTDARAAAYSDFEETCIAILKMPALNIPHHVIEMWAKVHYPGNFELRRTAMDDFLDQHRALLTHFSLRLLKEDMREDP
jgi:hypothetical protein